MTFATKATRIAGLALAAAILASCAGGVDDFLEPAEPTGNHPFPVRSTSYGRSAHEVHGIDIAKYQGDIDWQAVKRSGVAFAFIKATEGSDLLDKNFRQNWEGAKAAGVARGAYHFNYWCSSFRDQFEWFRRNVPRDPDAMPPVLDLEWNTHSPTCPRRRSRAHAQREIRTFLRLAEAWYGKRPIIYTDIRFYRDVLSDGSFSQYPLWVRAMKRLPHEIYQGRRWAFWQYSDRSRVPGIKGHVDKNAFAGTRHEWSKLVASNFRHRPVAEPTPESLPSAKPAPAPVMVADGKPEAARTPPTQAASKEAAVGQASTAKGKSNSTVVTAGKQGAPQSDNGKSDARINQPATTGMPLSLTPPRPVTARERTIVER